MSAVASPTPAPAASPAAVARASGGLTRRRKVALAIEIALIAAILAFAGMRETPLSRAQNRLAAIGTSVLDRFSPSTTARQVASIGYELTKQPGVTLMNSFQHGHVRSVELRFADPLPRFRWGLARTLFIRSEKDLPRDDLCFVLDITAFVDGSEWRVGVIGSNVPGLPRRELASK